MTCGSARSKEDVMISRAMRPLARLTLNWAFCPLLALLLLQCVTASEGARWYESCVAAADVLSLPQPSDNSSSVFNVTTSEAADVQQDLLSSWSNTPTQVVCTRLCSGLGYSLFALSPVGTCQCLQLAQLANVTRHSVENCSARCAGLPCGGLGLLSLYSTRPPTMDAITVSWTDPVVTMDSVRFDITVTSTLGDAFGIAVNGFESARPEVPLVCELRFGNVTLTAVGRDQGASVDCMLNYTFSSESVYNIIAIIRTPWSPVNSSQQQKQQQQQQLAVYRPRPIGLEVQLFGIDGGPLSAAAQPSCLHRNESAVVHNLEAVKLYTNTSADFMARLYVGKELLFTWYFPDDNTTAVSSPMANCSGAECRIARQSHTFRRAGVFTVLVGASNDLGSANHSITVVVLERTVQNLTVLMTSSNVVAPGSVVHFTVFIQTASFGETVLLTDFDDGSMPATFAIADAERAGPAAPVPSQLGPNVTSLLLLNGSYGDVCFLTAELWHVYGRVGVFQPSFKAYNKVSGSTMSASLQPVPTLMIAKLPASVALNLWPPLIAYAAGDTIEAQVLPDDDYETSAVCSRGTVWTLSRNAAASATTASNAGIPQLNVTSVVSRNDLISLQLPAAAGGYRLAARCLCEAGAVEAEVSLIVEERLGNLTVTRGLGSSLGVRLSVGDMVEVSAQLSAGTGVNYTWLVEPMPAAAVVIVGSNGSASAVAAAASGAARTEQYAVGRTTGAYLTFTREGEFAVSVQARNVLGNVTTSVGTVVVERLLPWLALSGCQAVLVGRTCAFTVHVLRRQSAATVSARALAINLELAVEGKLFERALLDDGRELQFNYTFSETGWFELNATATNDVSSVHGRAPVLVQAPFGPLSIVEPAGTRGSACGGWTLLAMLNVSEGFTWRRDVLYQWTAVAAAVLDGGNSSATVVGTGPVLCLNRTVGGHRVSLLVQNQADRLTAEMNVTDFAAGDGSTAAFVLQHLSHVEQSEQLRVNIVQLESSHVANCSSGWLANVEYGDGTADSYFISPPASSTLASHAYATSGLYQLVLNASCSALPDIYLVSNSYVVVTARVAKPTINGPRVVALNPLGTETGWTVGTVADPTLVFTWNFGHVRNDTIIGSEVLYRFTEPGVYTVTVTGRNSDGETVASGRAVVAYPIIEATAVMPAVPAGRMSNLTVEWSGCNVESVVVDRLVVDFGDGSPRLNVSIGSGSLTTSTIPNLDAGFPRCRSVLRHLYNSTGVYLVTVNVSSPVSTVQSYTVTYVDEPIAGLDVAASAYVVAAGDTVSFEARATSGRQLQFAWNFGIGNTSNIGVEILPRLDQELQSVARFRYDIPGTYYVAVSAASEAYQDQLVTVRLDGPVKVLKQVQQLSLTVNQTYLNVTASAWFTVEWTPAVSPVILIFNYNDSSANDNMTVHCAANASTCAVVVSHVYTAAGSYRPSVTALSSLGRRRDLTAYLGGNGSSVARGGSSSNSSGSTSALPVLFVQAPVGRLTWSLPTDTIDSTATRFYATLGAPLSMTFTVSAGTDLLVDWTYGDGSYDLGVANMTVLKWYSSVPSVSNTVPRDSTAAAGPWFNASVRVYNKVSFVESKMRVYIISNFTGVGITINDQLLSSTSVNVFDITKPLVLGARVYPSWMVYTVCSYKCIKQDPLSTLCLASPFLSQGEFSKKEWPANPVPVDSAILSVKCFFNKPFFNMTVTPVASDSYAFSLRGRLGNLSIGTLGKTTFVVNTTITLGVGLTASLYGTMFSWLIEGRWSSPSDNVFFTCMFTRPGTYNISLSANNTVDYSITSTTLLVLSYPCSIDDMKICSPWATEVSVDSKATFSLSDSIQLEASFTISCGSFDPWTGASAYWLILNYDDSPVYGSFSPSWLQRRSLVLPPGALPYGTYSANIVVEINATKVRRSADRRLTFTVVPSDLVAIIDGGLARTMSVGRLVALNASRSYDPDCFSACPKLSFRWYCSVSGKSIGSCFDSHEPANTSVVVMNTTNVFQKANSKLVDFTVFVCRSGTTQCANTSQTWDFSKPGKLDIVVDCPQCHAYSVGNTINAASPARLRVTCETCPADAWKTAYTWRSDRIEGSVVIDSTSDMCAQPPDRYAHLMPQMIAPTAAPSVPSPRPSPPNSLVNSVEQLTVAAGLRTTVDTPASSSASAASVGATFARTLSTSIASTSSSERTTVASSVSASVTTADVSTSTLITSAMPLSVSVNATSVNDASTNGISSYRGDGSASDGGRATPESQLSSTLPAVSSLAVSSDAHRLWSVAATVPAATLTSDAPLSTASPTADTITIMTTAATSDTVTSSAGVGTDSILLPATARATSESTSLLPSASTQPASAATLPTYGSEPTSTGYSSLPTSTARVVSDITSPVAAVLPLVRSLESLETTPVPIASTSASTFASTRSFSVASGVAAAENASSPYSDRVSPTASAAATVLMTSAMVSTTAVALTSEPTTVTTTNVDTSTSVPSTVVASAPAVSSTVSTTTIGAASSAATAAAATTIITTVRPLTTPKKRISIMEGPQRQVRSAPGDAVESDGRLPNAVTPATTLPTTTGLCSDIICARADDLPIYALSIYEMRSAPVSLSLNTSSRGDELLVLPGQLLDGGQYRLSATLDLGSGLQGTSVYYIRASYGPKSGTCGLDSKSNGFRATEGIEMQSSFGLNCIGWRDEAKAGFMAYEVRFSYAPDTSARYVLYRGFDPYVHVVLPAGSADHNNTVLVQLLVYNARGSATTACSRGYNVYPRIFTLDDFCDELFNHTAPMNSLIANTQDDSLRRSFLLIMAQKLFNIVQQQCSKSDVDFTCNSTAVNNAKLRLLDSLTKEIIRNRLEAEQTLAALKWALAINSGSQLNVDRILGITAQLNQSGLALVESNRYGVTVYAYTFDDAFSCISYLIDELSDFDSARGCPDCLDVAYRNLENVVDVFLTAQQLHKLTVDLPWSYSSSVLHVWTRRLDRTMASFNAIGCFFFNVSLTSQVELSSSRRRRSDDTSDAAVVAPCAELRIVALSRGAGVLQNTTSAVTVAWRTCYDYEDLPRPLPTPLPSFDMVGEFVVTLRNYVEVKPVNYTLSKHNLSIHSFTVSSHDLVRDLTVVIDLEVTADYRYPVVLYESRENPPDPSSALIAGTQRKLPQGQTVLHWEAGKLSPGIYYLALADAGLDAYRPVPGEVIEQNYSILAWWSACLSRANAASDYYRSDMSQNPALISSAYTTTAAAGAAASSPASSASAAASATTSSASAAHLTAAAADDYRPRNSEIAQQWTTGGCRLVQSLHLESVSCACTASWVSVTADVSPLLVNVTTMPLAKFFPIKWRPFVAIVVAVAIAVYTLVLITCCAVDRRRPPQEKLVPLHDNSATDAQKYIITLETGNLPSAGTTAKVSIVLHGRHGLSETRELLGGVGSVASHVGRPTTFQRNSRVTFLLTLPQGIGQLWKVQLWHDNSGSSPNWYLKRITIRDVNSAESYFAICEKWFAVEEDDGKVEREFMLSLAREQKLSFFTVLHVKIPQYMADYHMWASLVDRPTYSRYGRAERCAVCALAVAEYMALAAAYLYLYVTEYRGEVKLFDLAPDALLVGLVLPFISYLSLLLVALVFRKSRWLSYRLPVCRRRLRRVAGGNTSASKVDLSGIDNDGYDESYEDADVALEQSIQKWQSLQEWAQKQWEKRYQYSFPLPTDADKPEADDQLDDRERLDSTLMPVPSLVVYAMTAATAAPDGSSSAPPPYTSGGASTADSQSHCSSCGDDGNCSNVSSSRQRMLHSGGKKFPPREPAFSSGSDEPPPVGGFCSNRACPNSSSCHRGHCTAGWQAASSNGTAAAAASSSSVAAAILPAWCRLVAWLVCIGGFFACLCVTVYCSRQFQGWRIVMWVQSVCIAMLACAFVTQPLGVLMAALRTAFAVLFDRVPSSALLHFTDRYVDDVEQLCLASAGCSCNGSPAAPANAFLQSSLSATLASVKRPQQLLLFPAEDELEQAVAARQRSRHLRLARPPQERQLIEARKQRIKEKKLWLLLGDTLWLASTFALLLLLAFVDDVRPAYMLNRNVVGLFKATPGSATPAAWPTAGFFWRDMHSLAESNHSAVASAALPNDSLPLALWRACCRTEVEGSAHWLPCACVNGSREAATRPACNSTTSAEVTCSRLPFGSVRSFDQFWRWSQTELVETLYGGRLASRLGGTVVVGGIVRLRQLRVRPQPCAGPLPPAANGIGATTICYPPLSDDSLSTEPFVAGNVTYSYEDPSSFGVSSGRLLGQLAQYADGGHVVSLPIHSANGAEAARIALANLEAAGWLDDSTRAVIVETTLYNPAAALFAPLSLLCEVDAGSGGLLLPSVTVSAVRLSRYSGGGNWFLLACELLFFAMLLAQARATVASAWRLRLRFVRDPWSMAELAFVLVAAAYAVTTVHRAVVVQQVVDRYAVTYHRQFVSMANIGDCDYVANCLLGIMLFLASCRLLHLLRYAATFARLGDVLRRSRTHLAAMMVLYMVMVLAWSSLGVGLFNGTSAHFTQYASGFTTVASIASHNVHDSGLWSGFGLCAFTVCTVAIGHYLIRCLAVAVPFHYYRNPRRNDVLSMTFGEGIAFLWTQLRGAAAGGCRSKSKAPPEELCVDLSKLLPPEFALAEMECQVDELLTKMNLLSPANGGNGKGTWPKCATSLESSGRSVSTDDDQAAAGASSPNEFASQTTTAAAKRRGGQNVAAPSSSSADCGEKLRSQLERAVWLGCDNTDGGTLPTFDCDPFDQQPPDIPFYGEDDPGDPACAAVTFPEATDFGYDHVDVWGDESGGDAASCNDGGSSLLISIPDESPQQELSRPPPAATTRTLPRGSSAGRPLAQRDNSSSRYHHRQELGGGRKRARDDRSSLDRGCILKNIGSGGAPERAPGGGRLRRRTSGGVHDAVELDVMGGSSSDAKELSLQLSLPSSSNTLKRRDCGAEAAAGSSVFDAECQVYVNKAFETTEAEEAATASDVPPAVHTIGSAEVAQTSTTTGSHENEAFVRDEAC